MCQGSPHTQGILIWGIRMASPEVSLQALAGSTSDQGSGVGGGCVRCAGSWYLTEMSGVPGDRYLQEFAPLGTGGGLYHFRDQILAGGPEAFFVLNADVCSDFPLSAMLEAHRRQRHPFLLLGTTVRGLGGGCRLWREAGGGGAPWVLEEERLLGGNGGVIGHPEPFGCWEAGRGGGQLSALDSAEGLSMSERSCVPGGRGEGREDSLGCPGEGRSLSGLCLSLRLTGHNPSTTAALLRTRRRMR